MPRSLYALHDDTKPDLDKLRAVPEALQKMLVDRRVALRRITNDRDLSPDGQRKQQDQVNAAAWAELDRLRSGSQAAKGYVEKILGEELRPTLSVEEALLQEMQTTNAWRRMDALLRTGKDPVELIERAAANQDLVELRTLRLELPSYLAQLERPAELISGVLLLIERHELPLLPAETRRARELQTEVADGSVNLATALNYAQYELETGEPQTVLPAWHKGRVVMAEEEAPLAVAA